MTPSSSNVGISVILPAYNEAENLGPLVSEIEAALEPLRTPYEVIIIDDGSIDGTGEVLKRLAAEKPFVRPICFDGNYGQSAGFDAGFKAASGEYVVTADADGQNDPADIPRLLKQLTKYDAAVGWRAERRDPWGKRLTSRFANAVRRWATGDTTHDTGCSLKAFRREAISNVKLFDGMHRFLATLVKLDGHTVTEVVVNHRPRRHGRSKYSIFNRLLRPILDLVAVMWMQRRRLRYRVSDEED